MSTPYGVVLVGTDGSITAGRAVERAVDLAAACGAGLVVAYVGDPEPGRSVLDGIEAAYSDRLSLQTRLLTGDPADALLDLAETERADCIVVGNKGMTGAQRFLIGSVCNALSHKASCDVLVVHAAGEH